MNILLVEDSDPKFSEVETTLRSARSANGVQIDRAKSFVSAVRKLEFCAYDLLILDLMLPIRDGEPPSDTGGKQVLDELLDGTTCRHPSHIICLTAFEEIATTFKDDAEKRLVHVVIYNELDSNWRKSLSAKADYVAARLRDADTFPQNYGVDLAIVTSSPHVELNEVLRLPGFSAGEYHQSDALFYYSAAWAAPQDKQLSVVACAAPAMGMTAACVTACKLAERWKPRYLVMTGIAAGTTKDQEYGDILIAEAAFDYGSGKIFEAENGDRSFLPSPNQLDIDADLRAILQQWTRDQRCTDAIRRQWYHEQPRVPRLILGLLASGAAVVQSKALVDEIMSNSRKVVGLEMEAYAVFQVAYLARSPKPRVLVAKSVSDFADHRKTDNAQQYAAFTSARFVYEFFTNEPALNLGKSSSLAARPVTPQPTAVPHINGIPTPKPPAMPPNRT